VGGVLLLRRAQARCDARGATGWRARHTGALNDAVSPFALNGRRVRGSAFDCMRQWRTRVKIGEPTRDAYVRMSFCDNAYHDGDTA